MQDQGESVVTVEDSSEESVLEPVEPQGPEKIGCCRCFLSALGAICRKCCGYSAPEGDDPPEENQREIELVEFLKIPDDCLGLAFNFLEWSDLVNFMAAHHETYRIGFNVLNRIPQTTGNQFITPIVDSPYVQCNLEGKEDEWRIKTIDNIIDYLGKLKNILFNSRLMILKKRNSQDELPKQSISSFNKKIFFRFTKDEMNFEPLNRMTNEYSQRKKRIQKEGPRKHREPFFRF